MKREIIKLNEGRPVSMKNVSIDEIILDAYCIADAVNTDINDKTVDYSKVVVDIHLLQAGVKTKIYNGQAKPIVFVNALKKGHFAQLWDSSGYSNGTLLLAHGASDKAIRMVKARIPLRGGLNLNAGDELIVDVQVNDGAFHVDSDASSYIIVSGREAVVSQKVTPVFKTYWLEASRDNFTEELGDNVVSVALINTDKTSSTTADQIFSKLDIQSDKKFINETYAQAVVERNERCPQFNADAVDLNQSHIFHDGPELDDCRIDLTLVSGEVVALKNYVVVESFVVNREVANRGLRMDQRHGQKNMSKLA